VKVDKAYCYQCKQERLMAHNKEQTYYECLTCYTRFHSISCGSCRSAMTIFFQNTTEVMNIECPLCHEKMWVELMQDGVMPVAMILHIGTKPTEDVGGLIILENKDWESARQKWLEMRK
jgi:hypothetical protein